MRDKVPLALELFSVDMSYGKCDSNFTDYTTAYTWNVENVFGLWLVITMELCAVWTMKLNSYLSDMVISYFMDHTNCSFEFLWRN